MAWFLIPSLGPFLTKNQRNYEMCYLWNLSHSVDDTKLGAALPSIEATPLEEHLKEVLVLQSQAYQRVSASSSSALDETQLSPASVISRFQNGARDLR